MKKKHKLMLGGLVVFCTLFILVYFFPNVFIPYRSVEGDVSQQIRKISQEEGNYKLSLNGSKCYWIRPTHNGTHFLIEISKHNTTDSCHGFTLNKKEIVLDEPVNIRGKCVCGDYCNFKMQRKNGTKYLEMVKCRV